MADYVKVNEYLESRGEFVGVIGNNVYTNAGDILWILDASNPADPQMSAKIPHAGYPGYGGNINQSKIACSTKAAFIAHGDHVVIVDDATRAVYDLPGNAGGVSVNADVLYVADTGAGATVTAYDVSTPAAPILLGSIKTLPNLWGAFTKTGCPLLYCYSYKNVDVYSITAMPFGLTKIGSFTATEGDITDMDYRDGVLYVANYPGPIEFFDAATFQKLGEYDPYYLSGGNVMELHRYMKVRVLKDRYLIIGIHDWNYSIVDVGDLKAPVKVGDYWYRTVDPTFVGGYPRDVDVVGDFMVCQLSYNGIDFVDLTNPATPLKAKKYMTTGACFDSVWDRNTGLVYTTVDMGVLVTDFNHNPATLVSHCYYSGRGGSIIKEGNILYACSSWAGLVVLDSSNPINVAKISTIYGRGYANGFKKNGNIGHLILAAYDGLAAYEIYDFTNPASPVLVGTTGHIPGSNTASGLAVKGSRAYMTVGRSGVNEKLYTLDISDPTAPKVLNEISEATIPGWRPREMILDGDILYVANYYYGFYVFDVSGDTPVQIGVFNPGYSNRCMGSIGQKVGGNIYQPTPTGVNVVDVSNPTAPVKTGTFPIQGKIYDDGYVFQTDQVYGLSLYSTETQPPAPGAVTFTSQPTNASVYISDAVVGATPTTLSMPAGSYTAVFKLPGYLDYSVDYVLAGGESKTVNADLTPIPAPTTGTLEITTTPQGADAIIGGVPQGTTPLNLTLQSGAYDVVLKLAGYYDLNVTAVITVGAVTQVSHGFIQLPPPPPEKAVLNITSTPTGAAVLLDNQTLGVTPISLEADAGTHDLKVLLMGYIQQDITVEAAEGETKYIEVTLLPQEPQETEVSDYAALAALALLLLYVRQKKRA